ncbi:hypothetical protein BH09VER1_BH09VER1_44740 [soil metagenome]
MEPLHVAKHEIFAQHRASGYTQVAAYRAAYAYEGPLRNAQKLAYRLAARADVTARVQHLKETAAQAHHWARQHRLAYLQQAIVTAPEEIDATSPLCLGTRLTPRGVEYKTIDKIRALDLYSKLAGELTPQKDPPPAPPPIDTLALAMSRIRARRAASP